MVWCRGDVFFKLWHVKTQRLRDGVISKNTSAGKVHKKVHGGRSRVSVHLPAPPSPP